MCARRVAAPGALAVWALPVQLELFQDVDSLYLAIGDIRPQSKALPE